MDLGSLKGGAYAWLDCVSLMATRDGFLLDKMAFTLWVLWKKGVLGFFRKEARCSFVAQEGLLLWKEFLKSAKLQGDIKLQPSRLAQKWEKPPPPYIKINIDGLFQWREGGGVTSSGQLGSVSWGSGRASC